MDLALAKILGVCLFAAILTLVAVCLRNSGPPDRVSGILRPQILQGLASGSSIIQSTGANASIAVDTINLGSDPAALAKIQRDLEKQQKQAEQEHKERDAEENRKKEEEGQRQYRATVARTFLERVARTWVRSLEPFEPRNLVVDVLDVSFDAGTKEMRVTGSVHWHGGLPKGNENLQKMLAFAFGVEFGNGGIYPRGPRASQLELILQQAAPDKFILKKARSFGENDPVMALADLHEAIKIGEVFLRPSKPARP